jgi:hypothetical protein
MKFVWGILLVPALLFGAGQVRAQNMPEISLPVYGNWCGPDWPVNIYNAPAPVDPIDAACMRHDFCFAALGDFSCRCDITLLNELRNGRYNAPWQQNTARAIYDAIALTPCDSPDGMSYKQTMFAVDLFTDTLSGRGTPMDVLDRWQNLLFGP